MAKICLVLTGPRLSDCREQLNSQREWIDLAELRADLVDPADWPLLNDFASESQIPLVLTLRMKKDGGKWEGSAADRVRFFQEAIAGTWEYIDIEDDSPLLEIERAWIAKGKKVIRSFHDFETVPTDLAERVQANAANGYVPKAAVMPQNSREFDTFLEAVSRIQTKDRIVLAMGGFGFSSRILAEKLGSLWTYCSAPGHIAAPGHIDPQTLQELYRFHEIQKQTPVFGIAGNPVFHSKSPRIHNTGMKELSFPGVYIPFLVDDLEAFFRTADRFDVQGLSCTIPYKEDVIGFLSEYSPAVRATGACNTVYRRADGTWAGDNTDAPGFIAPVYELWGDDFSEKRVTVVGTGGAARGVVWALVQAGAKVLVLGRHPDKAQTLAQDLGAEWAPLGPESLSLVEDHNDMIVQTTSVGMGDQEGKNPIPWYEFHGHELAYDIIYVPERTVFLQRAEESGCRIILGKQMLLRQALGQFQRFTGQEYPSDIVETVF